ncbi:hypothetical protein GCM10020219_087610 [Nonomuraea dietziae]
MELHQLPAEGSSQPGDLRLQRVGRPLGRLGPVEAVDQLLLGDDPAGLGRQQDQQRSHPWPAERDGTPIPVEDPDGTEDVDTHGGDYRGSGSSPTISA